MKFLTTAIILTASVTLRSRALAALLLFSLIGGTVWAQVTASIVGTVKDMSGGVLPGAQVTVKHTETGLTRTAATDAAGNFSMTSLPVGQYELTAEKMGFRQQVRRGLNLVVGQQAVLNLILEVGNVEQQVTVTGEAPLVNTTLASTSGLVSEAQIKDMPLNGRSFDQLLTLNTGTVFFGNGSGTNVNLQGNFFSVVGRRPEENKYTINGIEYAGANPAGQPNGPYGASNELLGVDAVREFNVVQYSYGAEYGKRAGGQVSIVTSSGTNQLHGSAFEYLRNSDLDARNFFDQTIGAPPFKRNQFGGSLGGPLKKDKAFIFGNYEGFRQRLAVSDVAFVPDSLVRQGLLPCGVASVGAALPCGADPVGTRVMAPNLKQGILPYANAFWPAPNGPEQLTNGLPSGIAEAISNPAQSVREDFGLARFDYNVSAKDSFSISYLVDNGDKVVPQVDYIFETLNTARSQVLSFQETHVFSPTLVNSLNAGFTRSYAPQSGPPVTPLPASLDFVTGRGPGQIIIGGGVSSTSASAISQAVGNAPTFNAINFFTESDDVHYTRGKHSFSAGGWLQRNQENQGGPAQNISGTLSYPTLLAFLQDSPTAFNTNVTVTEVGYRQWLGAWYVQDEMKLRSNLTVNLGLRDEFTNGWNAILGRCSNLLFDQNGVVLTNPLIGDNCLTSNNAKSLWQPRLGVAWDPTGKGTWAVRSSIGIYNDLQDNQAFRLGSNPPFNSRLVLLGPALPQIPINPNTPLPPTCNPQLAAAKAVCAIYSEGGVDPNMHTPTITQWSFALERQIIRNLAIQLSYVGSEGYHMLVPGNNNSPYPQVCNSPAGCLSGGVGRPVVTVPQGTTYNAPTGKTCYSGNPTGALIPCYPNPFVNKLSEQMFDATTSYNAFNVSLIKRATRGLTFKTNYTFSKAFDYNSANSSNGATNQTKSILDVYDLALSKGISAFNLRHQFNANFEYQLPFGAGQPFGNSASGLLDKLIGGWQWNGIITAQSGFPLTPQVGANVSGTGDTDNPDVPNHNPNFNGPVIVGKVNEWYNPQAFTLPLSGTFGNVQRGSLTGPKLVEFDTSLFKNFQLDERFRLQFRAEAFNILNHANFSEPNAVVFSGGSYSSTAGVITSTFTTSRQIQFALRLTF